MLLTACIMRTNLSFMDSIKCISLYKINVIYILYVTKVLSRVLCMFYSIAHSELDVPIIISLFYLSS